MAYQTPMLQVLLIEGLRDPEGLRASRLGMHARMFIYTVQYGLFE